MKGIDFFNIKTGETIYVRRDAQIKALIESSDMGVNRQSDMGWRLGKEWVAKLRVARQDRQLMQDLAVKFGGNEVTDRDLMVAVYSREQNAEKQAQRYDNDAPYEQEYLESIKPIQEGGETTKKKQCLMNIPAHRLPLRDYQKDIVRAFNDPNIDELLLVIGRRGAKTTTTYSEGLVPSMVRNVLTAVAVYPTAKMGLDNFWTNIEDDGFKTVDHLPRELLASGGQSNSVDDMRRTLINGSVFRALGATNYEALRGANGKIYWFDEFADMPIEAVNVIAPITERNKGKRIYTGTPKIDGINGETMRRMHEAFKADKTGTKYTCYIDATHYTTPEELEKIRQGYILRNGNDFKFRQEMLLDWGQSSSASYYGHIIAGKKKDGTIGLYPYDTAYPVYTSWDLGLSDNMAIIFWQDLNGVIRIIDSYETSQIGLNTMIPFIKSKPYNYGWHFLPWDGVVHSTNDNVRRIDYMMQNGISNVSTLRKEGVSIGIDRVLEHLPKTQINEPTCTELIRKLNLYKRKFNPLTGDYIGAERNSASHFSDSVRYVWTAIAQNWIDGKFVMAQDNQPDVSSLEYDTSDLETNYYF